MTKNKTKKNDQKTNNSLQKKIRKLKPEHNEPNQKLCVISGAS